MMRYIPISSIYINPLLSGMCATNMTDPALHVSPDQNTEKLSELLPVYCIDCEFTANTGFLVILLNICSCDKKVYKNIYST